MNELNEDDDLPLDELAGACLLVALLAVVIALTALGISIWSLAK